MGYLKQKYTKEYFTGKNDAGVSVGYGVEGYDAFLAGKIRSIDLSILSQIDFKGKRVLEFGFGRGEAIKYAIDHGASAYTGVDFSAAAMQIASDFIKQYQLDHVQIYCDDALRFLKKYLKKDGGVKFDIVLMFDFVEHVPRSELVKLLDYIKRVLKQKSVLAINTPCYKFDNDVIADGLNVQNHEDVLDTSDFHDATKGMHCNKYSTISLQRFMLNNGFRNITEGHFFIVKNDSDNTHVQEETSYLVRWNVCSGDGYPLKEKYRDDQIEFPYKGVTPFWKKFSKGHLKGVDLFTTDEYREAAYKDGEYDKELLNDIQNIAIPSPIIFDVGGFMGVSSLLFSKFIKNSKVYSFEPNPYNFNRMMLNFSHNKELSKQIRTFPIALSDKPGEFSMLLSSNIDGGHSSTSRLENTHVEYSRAELEHMGFFDQNIKVLTLDNLVADNNIVPNVIKVDIEGAEHLFLIGAQKFLKKYSPILYIELHSQYCALMCSEILGSLGYESEIIQEEPDRRIMVKFVKNKNVYSATSSNFDQKNLLYSLRHLESVNKNLSRNIVALETRLNELSGNFNEIAGKYSSLESYTKKLLGNPVINIQLKIARTLKKFLLKK